MKKLAMFVVMACAAAAAVAEEPRQGDKKESRIWLPIGLSIITPPVQLPSPSHSVFGAMLNLGYGQVDNLAILDVGIINNVSDGMTGISPVYASVHRSVLSTSHRRLLDFRLAC